MGTRKGLSTELKSFEKLTNALNHSHLPSTFFVFLIFSTFQWNISLYEYGLLYVFWLILIWSLLAHQFWAPVHLINLSFLSLSDSGYLSNEMCFLKATGVDVQLTLASNYQALVSFSVGKLCSHLHVQGFIIHHLSLDSQLFSLSFNNSISYDFLKITNIYIVILKYML